MIATMEAKYPGVCDSCNFGVRPGQQIQLDDSNADPRWEHVTCPTGPAVCPECFTEVARNGACLCGAV